MIRGNGFLVVLVSLPILHDDVTITTEKKTERKSSNVDSVVKQS